MNPVNPVFRTARGLSLIEVLCVLAISALLLRGAVSTMRDFLDQQVLLATAASIETDVHYARSMALTLDQPVRMSVQEHPDGGSCTVIHTGAAHACRCTKGGHARCEVGARLLRLSEQLRARGTDISGQERSLAFAPGLGTVTPTATLVLTDRSGRTLHKIVNIMGRVRSCSTGGVSGFPACA